MKNRGPASIPLDRQRGTALGRRSCLAARSGLALARIADFRLGHSMIALEHSGDR